MKYVLASVVYSRPHLRRAPLYPSASRFPVLSAFLFLPYAFCFLLCPSCFSLSAFCFALFALSYLFCFQSIPNCPSGNSFVLITIRIAGGGGTPCSNPLKKDDQP